jgi:hypothetical protein
MKYTLKQRWNNAKEAFRLKEPVEVKLPEPPVWKVPDGHTVEFAFTIGGVDYYQHKDIFDMSCLRAFEALQIFDEWEQRTTKDKLLLFIEAMKAAISGKDNKIDLNRIHELLFRLEERTKWPIETSELAFKMGAVVYFDATEDPMKYNELKARQKIKFWKEHDAEGFFLYAPLRNLLKLPNIPPQDLLGSLIVLRKMDDLHLKMLRENLPQTSKPKKNSSLSTA